MTPACPEVRRRSAAAGARVLAVATALSLLAAAGRVPPSLGLGVGLPEMGLDPARDPAIAFDAVPGIGPATAAAIVAEAARAPFRTAGDLQRVRGVGRRTAAALAPHLRLPAAPSRPDPVE